MLIHSKKSYSNRRIILLALIVFLALGFFKISVDSKPQLFGFTNESDKQETKKNAPVILSSTLYTKDLLNTDKNKIYSKDNLSLYLNKELGAPTLMIVYKDSITDLERNGRFIAFLYLKDPKAWRAVNQRYDHIVLRHEQLVPVKIEKGSDTYFVFKFRLEHPYFNYNNLKKLEFVRHDRQLGRFTELFFEKDSLPSLTTPVENSLKDFRLTLKSKAYRKIEKKRNEALESGILVSGDDDMVKADIIAEGETRTEASIRLKGDWTDHLEHPTKWSYRIEPDGENTVFGMRKFSIQHPKSRNYIWEWLFNKVVKDNDIVGLRYDFLNVDILLSDIDSIVPLGIMALEESFDKILIENNRRREGLIFGFDETMIWDDRKQVRDLQLDYPEDLNRPKKGELPLKVYNENKTLSNPALSKQFQLGKNLILGLRDDKLALSEAFDVDRLAFYVALCNLFGADHGLMIENIRIYYNPVTHKLEPISFDSNSGFKTRALRDYPIGVKDAAYQAKLMEYYELVSSETFIKDFLNKYMGDLNRLGLELTGEFNEASVDIDILQHNANLIKNKIHPNTSIQSTLLSFSDNTMRLEVKNFSEFPILIDALVLENGKSLNQVGRSWTISPRDTLNIDFPLKKAFNNAFVSKKNKEGGFRYPKDLDKIQVRHHLIGSSEYLRGNIKAFSSTLDGQIVESVSLSDNTDEFAFIKIDESKRTLTFTRGQYHLDKTLFIPSKYKVVVEPGFFLDFTKEASIVSYAPFYSIGTADTPIEFISSDNTGGGIFVSSTKEKSKLEYTTFKGLSIPKVGFWELSGSVNFNEATVDVRNCVFEKNRSEDALNIIRTSFTMDQCTFIDTYSDAFDGDFVEGSITNSTFVNSGNDGIDVSGSTLTLADIVIKNPSDKALSAGEGSTMNGSGIRIQGGEIGVVSKDLSTITLTDVAIENTRLGVACFQKKSEFGPGIVNLKRLKFSGIEVPYLIAENSDLVIDDNIIQEKSDNVIDKMYGNEYGKSSR
ncbi:hypothetical protein [Pareuzebyella sediminis]|uniref:hypothetical protein n=1 Tax=Pareuzebyella sediminis TaxID=2607998 RepID=UPI0011EC6C25|nr:hypothetical protein [Pareuzebyella sediminis]